MEGKHSKGETKDQEILRKHHGTSDGEVIQYIIVQRKANGVESDEAVQ